ncbi:hypothetical protein TrVE_jg8319 [Triparma verrucosa]|uniref:Uncharacterized protein n=1 Tax=Triparma verrucosa TaxID=1606542 RepID=A0A9W7CBP0_9STRA|nr:hypothetical protein TrVE_jg8319 [Triparma verrucosa]
MKALDGEYDDCRVKVVCIELIESIRKLEKGERFHDKKGEDETNANAHSTNAHSTDSYADWVRNYARSEWGRKLISYIVDPGVEDCVKFHGVRALVNLVDEEEGGEVRKQLGRDWWLVEKVVDAMGGREGGRSGVEGKQFDEDDENDKDDEIVEDDEAEGDLDPDDVRNYTFPKPKDDGSPKMHPDVLPLIPFSEIQKDLRRILDGSSEPWNPKRAHEYMPSSYFSTFPSPSSPPFTWSSSSSMTSQISSLTSLYITSPSTLLSPSFLKSCSSPPTSLLPHALLYITSSIPTPLTPTITSTITQKTPYINLLLTYIKTGVLSGPYILPSFYDWEDVLEWRLHSAMTTSSSPWKKDEKDEGGKREGEKVWREDRAELLRVLAGEGGGYYGVIGKCAVGELKVNLEGGNYSCVRVLMEVVELCSREGGEEEVNEIFDCLGTVEGGGGIFDGIVKEWIENLEGGIFEEEKEEEQADVKEDNVRFTPGVMVRRRSKISEIDFMSPAPSSLNISTTTPSPPPSGTPLPPKVPIEWRIGLSLACKLHGLTVPSIPQYVSPFQPKRFNDTVVSYPQDAARIRLECTFGCILVHVAANCPGSIPRVDVKLFEGGVKFGRVKAREVEGEQRHCVAFEGMKKGKVECKVDVYIDEMEEVKVGQVCKRFEVPFGCNLKPCSGTSWCSAGDSVSFRSFWEGMESRFRTEVVRVEGVDEAVDEIVKRGKVVLDANANVDGEERMVEVVGWAFETPKRRRLLAVHTTAGPSSFLEVRAGKAETMDAFLGEGWAGNGNGSGSETVGAEFIKWLTASEWRPTEGSQPFVEEVGNMYDAFRASF